MPPLGSVEEEHVDRFYKAFGALQDLARTQRERTTCEAKYKALLHGNRLLGVLRAEFGALDSNWRERSSLRQAEGWIEEMSQDFNRKCVRGGR